jgi:hypothetical protein
VNILFNLYENNRWMDFVYNHTTIDLNFHSKERRHFKISSRQTITNKQDSCYGHNPDNYERFLIGKYSSFWNLIKANLIDNQEVSLMKFAVRCKVTRIEEENGRVRFTNYREEVEKYVNRVIKFMNQVGDLRIRKENDGVQKELKPQGIVTLKKGENSIRKNLKIKEIEEARLEKRKKLKQNRKMN